MDFKVIGILGDSIANGYWDTNGGYFYYLQKKLNEKSPFKLGFNQMSQDGDRICDVYHRMGSEVLSRNIDTLLIAVGVNDIIRPFAPDAAFDISEHLRAEYWEKLLELSNKTIRKTVVIGMLPVREECYPDQDWAELPIYTFNKDIEDYNNLIADLCHKKNIIFYNPYNDFQRLDLKYLYNDACHPNNKGHEFLADKLFEFLNENKILE